MSPVSVYKIVAEKRPGAIQPEGTQVSRPVLTASARLQPRAAFGPGLFLVTANQKRAAIKVAKSAA